MTKKWMTTLVLAMLAVLVASDAVNGGPFGRRGGRRMGWSDQDQPQVQQPVNQAQNQQPAGTDATANREGITTRRSLYPPQAMAATLELLVPGNAEVLLEGQPTTLRGMNRTFQTPPLDPSADYPYKVEVRWTGENGQPINLTRQILIQAGSRQTLDFFVLAQAPR